MVFLMADKQGEGMTTSFARLLRRTVVHNVLRGSLLKPIPEEKRIPRVDGKDAHNYQALYKDHMITLFCDERDVSPLSAYEHLLLAGIQSLEARYQTFLKQIEGCVSKLDWGSQLNVGDHVCVSIPDPEFGATQKASAKICYIGPVESLPGLTFGVEIMVKKLLYQGVHTCT